MIEFTPWSGEASWGSQTRADDPQQEDNTLNFTLKGAVYSNLLILTRIRLLWRSSMSWCGCLDRFSLSWDLQSFSEVVWCHDLILWCKQENMWELVPLGFWWVPFVINSAVRYTQRCANIQMHSSKVTLTPWRRERCGVRLHTSSASASIYDGKSPGECAADAPPDTIWVSSMRNTPDRKLSHWRIHLKSSLAPAEPGHDNKKSQAWRHLSSGSDVKHFPCGFGSVQPLPVVSRPASAALVMVWRAAFPDSTLLCCLQAPWWCLSVACLFPPHSIVTLLRNAARPKFESLAKILALNERFLNSEPKNAVYM